MASELELRWLKVDDLKGAAKHFALFCKDDIQKQADQKGFDLNVYQDAIKLVLSKLDKSLTLENLSKRIAQDNEENNGQGDAENAGESGFQKEPASTQHDTDDADKDTVKADINTQGERISGESPDAD
jgi:hypothetical protein